MDYQRNQRSEDDGLWEELQHQQAREMEQHRARHRPSSHPIVGQTTSEVSRGFSVFYQAALEAWKEHQEISRTNYDPISQSVDLQDFGIPSTAEERDADPTMMQFDNEPSPASTDFVFLPQLWFRPQAEDWGAVSNLDLFFQSLYHYFYNRGITPIIGKGLLELFTLAFTLVLSVFLFAYVDWHGLSTCKDETTCRAQFADYVQSQPRAPFLVFCYSLIFVIYTGFAVMSFLRLLQDAYNAQWVFEERLGISAHRLLGGAVDWDQDVVVKLLELQNSGAYRVAIHGQHLDALTIAQRIMRKENFMVALFNRKLLDLNCPIASGPLFCPTLEWSLYFCILNFMFNHKYEIRPAFYLDPGSLRRRFVLCGIAHLVFMPFLLFFVTLHFGLSNVYDWKSTQQYLGPKDWSLHAKWTFREFNELPHFFERRLAPSYPVAEKYLELFGSNEVLAAIGRLLVFLGGSLGVVLFALAALNDAILLHVKIADWNLLWFAGVVGALYSAGKALIPTAVQQRSSARNLYEEMDQSLRRIADHTHYYPDFWRNRGWDSTVHQSVAGMFQVKAKIFAGELLALIAAPYILCVSLASCAEPICEFVLAVRAQVPGNGEICGYSTFDFSVYGDESFGLSLAGGDEPRTGTLTESFLQHKSIHEAVQAYPKPRAKMDKMKQSLQSFKLVHPSWEAASPAGEASSVMVSNTEQVVHRDVVARQLETLAALEQNPSMHEPHLTVQDSYIRTSAPADAGAGALSLEGAGDRAQQ